MDRPGSERFHALDSFRGLCALSVVLFHTHLVASVTEAAFFRGADLFVDFFFVLSGFVIAHAYGAQQRFDGRRFFISRTFRLLPLHLFMLLAFVALEFVKEAAHQRGIDFNKTPFTGMYAPSQILPNALLVHAWTGLTENMSFNYPSWSISIEYYLYLIFAFTAAAAPVLRRLAWAGLSLVGFGLLISHWGPLTDLACKGLACFFAGALTHRLQRWLSCHVRPKFITLSMLEMLALLAIGLIVPARLPVKGVVASLAFCAVVAIYAFDGGVVSAVLRKDFFRWLGKLSYSIYLTHAAVLSCLIFGFMLLQKKLGVELAPTVSGIRFLDSGHAWLNNLLALMVLAVVVGVSAVTWRFVEMPGQELGRRLAARLCRSHEQPALSGQKSRAA